MAHRFLNTAAFLAFAAGVVCSGILFVLFQEYFTAPSQTSELRDKTGYAFINPLLECDNAAERISSGLVPFSRELQKFVANIKTTLQLNDMAVYYRDLNSGPWSGANESDAFLPASLLKVPIMIALFKAQEQGEAILSDRLTYSERMLATSTPLAFESAEHLQLGKSYPVEELIERMVKYSDNEATLLLLSHISPAWMHSVYARMGIESGIWGDTREAFGTISTKEYAGFFRILYNASFLTKEDSEKALHLLSQSEFNEGLVSGVPAYVTVAHKFGEGGSAASFRQLHDCGIVYYPERPYLLCVMTKGEDIGAMRSAIQSASRFVFEKVSAQIKQSNDN